MREVDAYWYVKPDPTTIQRLRDAVEAVHEAMVARDDLIVLAIADGLTQTDVAKMTGMNQSTVSRICRRVGVAAIPGRRRRR